MMQGLNRAADAAADSAPLDRLDRKIIATLARDGRMPYREIARALGVSEGTIRARVGRLQDRQLVRVTVVGSPLALGVNVDAIILIKVKPGTLRETARIASGFPNVRFVGTSFGSADLIIQTLHNDVRELHEFVSETLPGAAPGLVATETFQLAEVLKSSWTWGDWFEHLEAKGLIADGDGKAASAAPAGRAAAPRQPGDVVTERTA